MTNTAPSAENAFRRRLEEGTPQLGGLVTTCTPLMIEVYGDLGFDFALLDFEHGGPSPYDSARLCDLVRAGEVADIDLVVRLPSGRGSLLRKVLDTGVQNVLVPRVETPDEVLDAAAAARFTYDGEPGDRGVGSARSTRWGGEMNASYLTRADDEVTLGVMVENDQAVTNLTEILTTPGVDFALLGHYDLAVSLGCSDPAVSSVQSRIDRFERVCRNTSTPFGRYTGADADAVADAVDDGYRLLLVGDETSAVRTQYREILADW